MGWKKERTVEARGWRLEARDSCSPSPVPRILTSAQRLAPSAFTLTELLVVITIIAILASLITAGAINALNAAKRARISLEINQLGQSMEQFKNKYSAYPPNLVSPVGQQNYNGQYFLDIHQNDLTRTFKKAFPRSKEPVSLVRQLAGDSTVGGTPDAGGYLKNGLDGSEAIYFWLGGFSSDPQYPISGPGGPSFRTDTGSGLEEIEGRDRIYAFDLSRLGPRNDNGFFHDTSNDGNGRYIVYNVPINGVTQTRRINLWRYTPSGSAQPYVYFDVSRHRAEIEKPAGTYNADYTPWCYITPGATPETVWPLLRLNQSNKNRIDFVNNNKYQILHAGLDDTWGNFLPYALTGPSTPPILFPTGPFTGDVADTLTNFTSGTLASEQE